MFTNLIARHLLIFNQSTRLNSGIKHDMKVGFNLLHPIDFL